MDNVTTKTRALVDIVIESTSFNLVILMITTLSGIIVARYLGPEGRGDLASILAIQSAVITILAWGFPHFYARATATVHPSKIREIVWRRSAQTAAILATMAIFVSLATGPLLLPSGNAYIYLFLVLWPSTSLLATLLIALSQGAGDWRNYNLLRTAFPIVNLAAIITCTIFGSLNIEAVLLSMVVGNIAVLALARHANYPLYSAPKTRRIISDWQASKQYAYSAYAVYASNQIDILIGAITLPASSLGYYAVAKTISSVSSPLFTAISAALFTKTANDNPHHKSTAPAPQLVSLSVIHAIFILLGAVQLILIAAIPFLTVTLFGPQYSDATQVAVLLAGFFTFLGMANILEELAKGLGRPELAANSRLVSLVLVALLAAPLSYEFKEFGLAMAAGVGQLARFAWIYRSIANTIPDTNDSHPIDERRPLAIVRQILLNLISRTVRRVRKTL